MKPRIERVGFSDKRLKVHGLPWFEENAPNLWRFPGHRLDEMPEGVCTQARFPSGGRIRFRCDTSQLRVRVKGLSGNGSFLGMAFLPAATAAAVVVPVPRDGSSIVSSLMENMQISR